MQFTTGDQLRAFLRLCIDPGAGRDKRTPTRLVEALPASHETLKEFTPPYLAAFARAADELTTQAEEMRHIYASGLLAWIREEEPSNRLLALSLEATAHARDCSWCKANGTLSHRCADAQRIAAALLAPAAEDAPAEDGPQTGEEKGCAHESWDVTSEYRDGTSDEWVQARRCNDCGEGLPDVRSAEPHFDQAKPADTAATAATLGHASVEETAAAYADEPDVWKVEAPAGGHEHWTWKCRERRAGCGYETPFFAPTREAAQGLLDQHRQGCRAVQAHQDEEERPALPAALPWLEVLHGEEYGILLGEIALAMHKGRAVRPGESTDDRNRRTVGHIADVLACWRDSVEHRRPTTYVTDDGRAWTYQGEHRAENGPALYESPTSPKAYTVPELTGMYRWVAEIVGGQLGNGETVKAPLDEYARMCRVAGLAPSTTVLVRSGATDTVHAAVHVALSPDLELADSAVDEIRTALCDGLAVRED
ncbi:hypothetical protein [Streptomyces variegatus]|uniref:hypothetical protein n=1 Tax=Streptomyces variegatus TaxID=284040 RepID=UPI003C2EDB91